MKRITTRCPNCKQKHIVKVPSFTGEYKRGLSIGFKAGYGAGRKATEKKAIESSLRDDCSRVAKPREIDFAKR